MRNGILVLVLFSLLACTTQPLQKDPEKQPVPEDQSVKQSEPKSSVEKNASLPPSKSEGRTPSGSPMGSALESMEKAGKEMAEIIKIVSQIRAGDSQFDCQNAENRRQTFQALQVFFGKRYFEFDDYTFWFYNAEGEKIGVNENDGLLNQCTAGMFDVFKRLIAIQYNKDETVRTEFYVDTKTGDLMVHRYHGPKRTNENHKLAGY